SPSRPSSAGGLPALRRNSSAEAFTLSGSASAACLISPGSSAEALSNPSVLMPR
ncbi:MAG TPA: hypothetical protein IAC18_08335, partial [Candidatus Scatomorpha merdipullorum]|nr:hypothetical protein [Candidatus Scatomorpha merdipullorum]